MWIFIFSLSIFNHSLKKKCKKKKLVFELFIIVFVFKLKVISIFKNSGISIIQMLVNF